MKNKIQKMSIEYGITAKKNDAISNTKILSSIDAYKYAKNFYNDDINIYESSFIILLDTAKNTKGYVKISQGGTVGTVIDVKIICYYVITALADSVVLVHNHPSGNRNFSQQDIDISLKIKEALKYLDVSLIDHIIITHNSYNSMADEGIL